VPADIIIATRNNALALRETLLLLIPQISGRDRLLVADNGSTDSTASVCAELGVERIFVPDPGQAHAQNSAFGATCNEAVLLTDDDARPGPVWVERLKEPLLADDADAVVGGVALPCELAATLTTYERGLFFDIPTRPPTFEASPYLNGCNMGFRRAVLAEVVRGFDENLGPGRLGYMADTLFCQQILQAGGRVRFVEGAEVQHAIDPERLRLPALREKARRHGRSTAYVRHHWVHGDEPARVLLRLLKSICPLAAVRLHATGDHGISRRDDELTYRCALYRAGLALTLTRRRYDRLGANRFS